MWVVFQIVDYDFAAVHLTLSALRVIRCAAKGLVAIGRKANFSAQPAHVYEFTP